MLSTFTELNRKRPEATLFDFITHATCSTVHAADDRSVMEALETLPAIIGVDEGHDRRQALSHRPERHRSPHEPLRQGRA
jgi:hypothetical protein